MGRVATNLYITYTLPGSESAESGVVVTKDVSGGGILFESLKEIPVGTVFDLLIHLPSTISSIQAKGKVVRTEKTRPYGRYDVGMAFVEIDESDRRELIKYLVSTVMTPKDYETLFADEEFWRNLFPNTGIFRRFKSL